MNSKNEDRKFDRYIMIEKFASRIFEMLSGQYDDLSRIPHDRLDWNGISAVIELYDSTSGQERDYIIDGFRKIIRDTETPPKYPPYIKAQVLDIALSLDIAQLDPDVKFLESKSSASEEPLRSAIAQYFSYRRVRKGTAL